MKRLPGDLRAAVTEDIRLQLVEGFVTAERVVELIYIWYHRRVPKKSLRWRVARALATHRREQKTWPAVTDCDRLDTAFEALEVGGLVARQHYMGCSADGASEIKREVADERAAGRRVRGYVFYHFQNTETAIDGHGLHLAYAAVPSTDAADKRVARQIVAALVAQGLEPEWDGNPDRCVFVPIVWQRRR